MIVQGYDLLLGLGAPQASGEYRDEMSGAASFAQFLPHNLELSQPLLASLAPSSQLPLPLFSLSFEPSMSHLADAGEVVQEEQEHHALEEILAALQNLFPGMIPGAIAPLHNTPSAATEGVPGEEVSSHTQEIAIAPLSVAVVEGADSLPQGGRQASTAGDVRQVLAPHGSSTAPAAAEPAVPEQAAALATGKVKVQEFLPTAMPENSQHTEHTDDVSPAPRIAAHSMEGSLTIPTQEDEVALGNTVRENPYREADAATAETDRQQTRSAVPADASALTSEDTSFLGDVRAPFSVHQLAEGSSEYTVAHTDAGRFSRQAVEVAQSAEQPSIADLPRQTQLSEPPAMGSLRHFPLSRSTVLLQLDPPELGTLFVQVRHVDEQLTASFWAESSEVRSLLQSHFPELNQLLSQQGLTAQQISLHLATGNGFAEQFGQFSQQHSAAQTFSQGNRGKTSGGRQHDLDNEADHRQPNNGRVDITI
jgi:flagellar hook-length control protein FliK